MSDSDDDFLTDDFERREIERRNAQAQRDASRAVRAGIREAVARAVAALAASAEQRHHQVEVSLVFVKGECVGFEVEVGSDV